MTLKNKLALKRVFDLIFAIVALIIWSLPMFFIGALILLIDKKLPIFAQKRVGQHGALFTMYKFRTMRHHRSKNTITTKNDSRITPLGGWLRRHKLDELPELLNILWGNMSFVGPRPDVQGYADQLRGENAQILLLKPALTGIATLKYYDEETILAAQNHAKTYNDTVIYPEKTRLNLWYFYHFSVGLDVKIIADTIFKTKLSPTP